MSVRYSKYLPGFTFITDLLLLNLAFNGAYFLLYSGYKHESNPTHFILLVNIFWVVISALSQSFKIPRPLPLGENINKFLLALIFHFLTISACIYFFKLYDVAFPLLITIHVLFFLFVSIHRTVLFFFLEYIRKKGYNHREIVIIGDKEISNNLLNLFAQHPEYGYDLIDFISEEQLSKMPRRTLIKKLLNKRPDEIFICYKQIDKKLLNLLFSFGDINLIKIKVVTDLILKDTSLQLLDYPGSPILKIVPYPVINLRDRILKRAFDIIFSLVIMVFGAPVFVLLYFITKFSSKGPAFYKQERIGKDERSFYIYKFRSMYIDSEAFGPKLSSENDPRITKWGGLMRKTRLDELPQFWNVLKGEMSVVGPRPERQYFIEKIVEKNPNYKRLLSLKPGITSIGQVHYGYAENVDQMCERLRYDLLYLKNIGINNDLNIIIKTIKVMVQSRGK
jgi:exopolysaccharide biosynthesis polyprenyl glycosylphosphotransferase